MNSKMLNMIKKIPPNISRRLKLIQQYLRILQFVHSDIPKIPLFVLGCHRSGTTMLLNVMQRYPECSVYHEGNKIAYKNFRIKSDNIIKRLIKMSDKKIVVFKPLNDVQHTDRFLKFNENVKAIWIYRNYDDVVKSAVTKWGAAHKDIMIGISQGYKRHPGQDAIRERMTPEMLRLVKRICNENMTFEDGAALLWYARNLIYFKLALHKDHRVLLVKYEDLVKNPIHHFERIFDFLFCPFNKEYINGIHALSVRKTPLPIIDTKIKLLLTEMMDRLDEQYLVSLKNV